MKKLKPFIRASTCYREKSREGNLILIADNKGKEFKITEEKLERILNRFKN